MDFDFIMMGYNLPRSRGNKKRKSKILVETLKVIYVMPWPKKLFNNMLAI